jgi:hypothetical protein
VSSSSFFRSRQFRVYALAVVFAVVAPVLYRDLMGPMSALDMAEFVLVMAAAGATILTPLLKAAERQDRSEA